MFRMCKLLQIVILVRMICYQANIFPLFSIISLMFIKAACYLQVTSRRLIQHHRLVSSCLDLFLSFHHIYHFSFPQWFASLVLSLPPSLVVFYSHVVRHLLSPLFRVVHLFKVTFGCDIKVLMHNKCLAGERIGIFVSNKSRETACVTMSVMSWYNVVVALHCSASAAATMARRPWERASATLSSFPE